MIRGIVRARRRARLSSAAGAAATPRRARAWPPNRWVASRLAGRHPEVLYLVETDEPVAALTIDDGPDPISTGRILDTLRDHEVPATFFVITDRIVGNEGLLERMVAEGHEIGNHLTRDEPSIRLPREEFARELRRSHDLLGRYAVPSWFRPGAGRFDRTMLDTVSAHGYRLALGSVYPYDPHVQSSWFASRFIRWTMHPGAVIVLHDVGGRGRRTLRTLSRVLPELKRRGYRFLTLSRLAAWRVLSAAPGGRREGA